MRLRDHPAMQYRGMAAWPPAFGGSHRRGSSPPIGERGTLVGVEYREDEPAGRRLALSVEFRGQAVGGAILVDDEALLPFLKAQLSRFLGRSLGDVGDALDLDVQLDLLRTSIRLRLRQGGLPRRVAVTPLLTAGQPLSHAIRLGPAQGQRCAGCDEPILTRQNRPFYLSAHGTVVLDELCERIWLEER
jgi:hypothetical protein